MCIVTDMNTATTAGGRTPSKTTGTRKPDFDRVDFSGQDIRAAIADYEGRTVFFHQCDFSGTDMQDFNLADSVFDRCTLNEARLRECVLDRVRVTGGSCVAADFASADLNDAVFSGVDLTRARFTGAVLADAQFVECRMIGADLTALRGLTVTLTIKDCNLQLASLQDTNLRGTHLSGSDLTEADLRGTDLRDAVLNNCRLRQVDLSHTHLDGTDLRGADLGEITADSPRQLRGAVISHSQAVDVCAALGLIVLD